MTSFRNCVGCLFLVDKREDGVCMCLCVCVRERDKESKRGFFIKKKTPSPTLIPSVTNQTKPFHYILHF